MMSDSYRSGRAPPLKRARINADPSLPAGVESNGISKSEGVPQTKEQVDAHVKEFLRRVYDANTNKTKKKPVKEKRDMGTQTDPAELGWVDEEEEEEDDEEEEQQEEWYDPQTYWYGYDRRGAPKDGYVPNQTIYSEETLKQTSVPDSQNQILQQWYQFQADGSNGASSSSTHHPQMQQVPVENEQPKHSKMNSKQVKLQFDKWVKDYEKWFSDMFGSDMNRLEDNATPAPQPPAVVQSSAALVPNSSAPGISATESTSMASAHSGFFAQQPPPKYLPNKVPYPVFSSTVSSIQSAPVWPSDASQPFPTPAWPMSASFPVVPTQPPPSMASAPVSSPMGSTNFIYSQPPPHFTQQPLLQSSSNMVNISNLPTHLASSVVPLSAPASVPPTGGFSGPYPGLHGMTPGPRQPLGDFRLPPPSFLDPRLSSLVSPRTPLLPTPFNSLSSPLPVTQGALPSTSSIFTSAASTPITLFSSSPTVSVAPLVNFSMPPPQIQPAGELHAPLSAILGGTKRFSVPPPPFQTSMPTTSSITPSLPLTSSTAVVISGAAVSLSVPTSISLIATLTIPPPPPGVPVPVLTQPPPGMQFPPPLGLGGSFFVRMPMPMPMPPLRPRIPRAPLSRGSKPNIGPWGPLLRYGSYGIDRRVKTEPTSSSPKSLGTDGESERRASLTDEESGEKEVSVATVGVGSEEKKDKPPTEELISMKLTGDEEKDEWLPPPQPPQFVLLPKQAMICALQLRVRPKAHEISVREADPRLRLTTNYAYHFREAVQQGVGLAVLYLYSRVSRLPPAERNFYLEHNEGGMPDSTMDHVGEMYLCDILIGDVLVAQGIADWKMRARERAVKQAFKVLSQFAYIVGSTRRWYETDYLVLCLSEGPRKIPFLPPFLSDPTEPLWKKDRYINESSPVESFVVVNPKPLDEFWLYTATNKVDMHDPERILSRSAEFCQMLVSYEVEVSRDGTFRCIASVDKEEGAVATALTLPAARFAAAKALLVRMNKEQPVVGLREGIEETNEDALVDSLMWGRQERKRAIPLHLLNLHIDIPPMPEKTVEETLLEDVEKKDEDNATVVEKKGEDEVDGAGTVEKDDGLSVALTTAGEIEWLVQAYAESALITPVIVTPDTARKALWPEVRASAANWGLMTRGEPGDSLLVCKRIPMPRLQKTLLEFGVCGVFQLLKRGQLSEESLKRFEHVDPVVEGDDKEEEEGDGQRQNDKPPVDEEYALVEVKNEPIDEDCIMMSAELNTRQNPIEILDDLPKQLIPGIDF